MTSRRVAFIFGTRPEIIKMAPLLRLCETHDIDHEIVHTGQHYSESLDAVFFEQLDLREPDHTLEIGSDTHGAQTGAMLSAIEGVIAESNPDTVVVQGDTNSTMAGALAASKMSPDVAHVEAGLRSFDRSMPEEINRVVTDHVADYLFAPTQDAAEHLSSEGLGPEGVSVTGNTIVDSVFQHRDLARHQSDFCLTPDLSLSTFVLLTVHRAENVDDPAPFESILNGVATYARQNEIPVIYPVHPRAQERLKNFDIAIPPEIRTVEPLDFLDFLQLEAEASIVFTDSGGVQEETCILGTPCVTVRQNTERPETVATGANIIAGTAPDSIVAAGEQMADLDGDWENPFGDGRAGERILTALVPELEIDVSEINQNDTH